MLTRWFAAEYPGIGALHAMGSSHPCPFPAHAAALLSSFLKCPPRAAEDGQGGKERGMQHDAGRTRAFPETLSLASCKAGRQ